MTLPVHPVHKMRKLVLLGRQGGNRGKRRKSENSLYSCVFEAMFFENQSSQKRRIVESIPFRRLFVPLGVPYLNGLRAAVLEERPPDTYKCKRSRRIWWNPSVTTHRTLRNTNLKELFIISGIRYRPRVIISLTSVFHLMKYS